jgi:hypothetical protein
MQKKQASEAFEKTKDTVEDFRNRSERAAKALKKLLTKKNNLNLTVLLQDYDERSLVLFTTLSCSLLSYTRKTYGGRVKTV